MNSELFMSKAINITETLENFEITFRHSCILTYYAGNGVYLVYDGRRAEGTCIQTCRSMLDAFPSDRYVLSYIPLSNAYCDITYKASSIHAAEDAYISAQDFKNYLLSEIGESYYSESSNSKYHVMLAENSRIYISADEIENLMLDIVRTEEYIMMIGKRAAQRRGVISYAGTRIDEVCRRHEILTHGGEYLGKCRKKDKRKSI